MPAAVDTSPPAPALSDPPTKFSPTTHLAYTPPAHTVSMADLSLPPTPLSDFAATTPFPLLSLAGIRAHRAEILSPAVLANCMHPVSPGSVFLRGMAPRYAPFIHAFWHSPEVLRIVSENAGVDLVPAMDYEVGHTNVQLGPEGVDGLKKIPVEPPMATGAKAETEGGSDDAAAAAGEDRAIVGWHKDSHPFVCIVMLSDARDMVGGETELRCGDGRTVKVRAPQMGGAVVLQGRYIEHVALPTTNMAERITLVASFRPRDPTLLDETTNMNTKPVSHLTELNYQWATYRLEVLAQRAQGVVDALREKYAENVRRSDPEGKPGMCRIETVDVAAVEKWVKEQTLYLEQTVLEMK